MNGRHEILTIASGIPSTMCLALLLVLWLPVWAGAHSRHPHGDVVVDVVGTDGHRFATYPARGEARDVRRTWLEARYREPYRIRVSNRSGRRVGLVITVDGRNIISGARSELTPDERMYVLEPWESAEYEGWRTSSERVNEFYFTDWPDSYAEAFGDRSARGVIAVAVYRERHPERHRQFAPGVSDEAGSPGRARAPGDGAYEGAHEPEAPASSPAPAAGDLARGNEAQKRSRAGSRTESSAGTGFGDEVYSPVRVVSFEAQRQPSTRHFIKYEWRETLCRKAVIDCRDAQPNRFWPEDRFGYAPHPPGRGR